MTAKDVAEHTPSWRERLRDGWDLAVGADRHLTADDLAALTRAVEAVEKRTSGEIVVALRPCSGTYRDVDYLVGAVLALVGLLLAIHVPFPVHEYWLPVELVGVFALGAWISAVTPLRRWLTTSARRNQQVADAAAAVFLNEGVMLTEGRTGVLIYWSLLERRVRILADLGVHTAVPPAAWNELLFEAQRAGRSGHPVPPLLTLLDHLGSVLSKHLPASASDRDELPNAPRVLS